MKSRNLFALVFSLGMVSANAYAMESATVAEHGASSLPVSFHLGGGVLLESGATYPSPVFDLSMNVGITESFSLGIKGSVALQNISVPVVNGSSSYMENQQVAVSYFGLVPSWNVRKKSLTMSAGPYIGAAGSQLTLGASGTLLFHFSHAVGFSFSPTFGLVATGPNKSTFVSITGGVGFDI